jgi:hypothetical protein
MTRRLSDGFCIGEHRLEERQPTLDGSVGMASGSHNFSPS